MKVRQIVLDDLCDKDIIFDKLYVILIQSILFILKLSLKDLDYISRSF